MRKIMYTFLSILMVLQSVGFTSTEVYGKEETGDNSVITRKLSMQTGSNEVENRITSIFHEQGYILGVKGTLNADQVKLIARFRDYTQSEIKGSQCQWSFSNPDIAIYSNGEIKILKKGMTTATVTLNGVSTTLLLLAKEKDNDNYILYEENFDKLPEGSLPQGWIRKQGTTPSAVGVKNGTFEIDARAKADNPTRVILPEYLSKFGNYIIEADITNLDVNDKKRWNSIMFRIQNNDYPYYQMAVRKNATMTNGVEFAERDPSNLWNVLKTTFFYENINNNDMYHYTVKVHDNRVQELINDITLIDSQTNGRYLTGGIGFQANGSVMRIDNIKITIQNTPFPKVVNPEDNYARVREADTKIVMAPTIVTEIKNKKEFDAVISKGQAATAILTINRDLEVLSNTSDYVIGTVSSMYESMKAKVIPAYRVNDSESAKAISLYLKNNKIEDVFVISKKPELVKQARENYEFIRGIVEFDNVSEQDINKLEIIKSITNSNLAKIAVIPSEAASKSNIRYLQQRLITVWTKETEAGSGAEQQIIQFHRMITAGASGIVTAAPETVRQALSVYNHDTTIVRAPFFIGHRGVPDLAPENTLEGCELAFQLGANMVENDIWLTKVGADGKQHLVVMHDDTIDRTSNGSGKIADMTLEELRKYFANKQFAGEYPTAKIPTLDKYFEKFTGRDQVIFTEIKGCDPLTVENYTELIKNLRTDERLVTISFDADQLNRTRNKIPGMSLGYLLNEVVDTRDAYVSLRNALWQVQVLNSSYMPNYNTVEKGFLEVGKHRGMTVWPWTFTDKDTIIKYFKMGVCGMTTNCTQVISDWAVDITPRQSLISMKKGETTSLGGFVKTYSGKISEVVPDVVVLSGKEIIEVNGNSIKSKKSGFAYVMLRYTARLSHAEGDTYDIYSAPVKIQIG